MSPASKALHQMERSNSRLERSGSTPAAQPGRSAQMSTVGVEFSERLLIPSMAEPQP